MISSRFRVTALFFLFCAFALVLSTPTPKDLTLYKRSTGSDVLSILTTVQLSTNSVLPKIDALVAAGQVSDATIRPLLSQLSSTASTAIKSVSSLQHPITFPSGGASQADIVSLTGQILSSIGQTGVGLVLVLPNLFSTAVFVVTSLLQDLTGIVISIPGFPIITLL